MKRMRKLAAMLLAVALCSALAVPCFAAAPEKNAIRLKAGDSYTFGDTTITVKRDERPAAQRAAERAALLSQGMFRATAGGRYYYVQAVEYQDGTPWDQVFNCRGSRGNALRFDLDNYPSSCDTILQLTSDGWRQPVEVYIEAGQSNYAEVHTENPNGLSDTIEMSIYGTGGKMWFALSVYQYWK